MRAVGAVAAASVGLPITLVLDNARYQKCAVVQALASSLGIELLYLPGYSPNLNLIERLWRFVRKQSLDSIYYEDLRDSRLRSISAWAICPQYTRARWQL